MIENSDALIRWIYELEQQDPEHGRFVSMRLARSLEEVNGWDKNTTLGLIAGLASEHLLEDPEHKEVKGTDGKVYGAVEVMDFDGLSQKGRQKAIDLPLSNLG